MNEEETGPGSSGKDSRNTAASSSGTGDPIDLAEETLSVAGENKDKIDAADVFAEGTDDDEIGYYVDRRRL